MPLLQFSISHLLFFLLKQMEMKSGYGFAFSLSSIVFGCLWANVATNEFLIQ